MIRARGLQSKPGSKVLPGKSSSLPVSQSSWASSSSSLGKSLPGERQEVFSKGKDFCRPPYIRSSLSTATHLSSTVWWLCTTGKFILYNTSLFNPSFQVTIWGDYGRVEGTKVFMGVAQILLDNLDLSHIVIGWYKLFGTSSLVSVPPGGGKESFAKPPDKPAAPENMEEEKAKH